MGVEDWESKYKGQRSTEAKPQLSDFLDEEEDNVILRMGRPYPGPSHISICQNTQRRGSVPATYPEGYDTIDRRRKKKIRDPGGLLSTEADKTREEAFPSDLALHRQKRGELFMQKVTEMQEEDERMTSCLRPYKNGLLYKTRMWAKNELDNTLENYVAYKKEQDAKMRTLFDFDSVDSEDLHYSIGAEEDFDDIAFITEDFPPENARHFKEKYSLSYEGHIENSQKKCGKAKIGGWTPEAMLSPVEEPSDEYVDPMDELQCLVETVSEYLAEKEEEISKYGSLPKSSKSRLSSQGSNITDSFGEDQNSSKDPNPLEKPREGETQMYTSSDQGISGGLCSEPLHLKHQLHRQEDHYSVGCLEGLLLRLPLRLVPLRMEALFLRQQVLRQGHPYLEAYLVDLLPRLSLSPVESSRFGSSGNLSQTSSQLSETGQESTGGSELEESFHSYHSTGFYPSTNGQPRTNGHLPSNGHSTVSNQDIRRMSPEVSQCLKNDTPAERGFSKLQRFHDDGPPLPFSPSRVRWLKAINKVRVQLRESIAQIS
ncbi:hypothetical protein PAMA_008012 [Pampus argenteus]